ncbi:methylated-DNA--[protein]-cysteine S-methyltransferase [Ideonella sp.]|uniref:methylated-DNA--[protein]-cysteine S-methyltransferase n=1 Tax=Ideonella sp. TaxID=1929293 RepID=UPI002B46674F|nr:methylated-DNA--[protein]-cysteine S-methyltransferase [Ideonella sp.]HJV68276.1 methylated-DNA--[protein]-cysteine S-methyltransferase [Ideonella sp.]
MNTTLNTVVVAQATIPTPLGAMLLAATAHGLAGCWFTDQAHHPGVLAAPVRPGNHHIAQAADELDAYWQDAAGSRFRVPLDPQGTAFQQAVWQALLAIPAGSATSYGALARQLGRPQAMRAVGAAVGRNPLGIIVPCHRVLGSDGSLTGYAGGLHRKTELLQREGFGRRRPGAMAEREMVAA